MNTGVGHHVWRLIQYLRAVDFKYLTPKIRLDPQSLTLDLLQAKGFHAVCSSNRIIDIVTNLTHRRDMEIQKPEACRPIIVWEPVPDLCLPNELENCLEAIKLVDVISPNHVELAAFFTNENEIDANPEHLEEELDQTSSMDGMDLQTVETHAKAFLASGIGPDQSGSIVVRCGAQGCYAASRKAGQWFPAFHTKETNKVVDPTGGGNAFLGGLTIALARGKDTQEACAWASVAASFAIEQIGMPTLGESIHGELWNSDDVWDRLNRFMLQLT